MRKISFAVIIFFLCSLTAIAQSDKNGGSIYSIFGLGDLNYTSSTRNEAMGVLGLSLNGNYTNSINPASWTKIDHTIFSTRFNLERLKSTDGTTNSKRDYGNFEDFSLAIPLNKGNGWILNLGLDRFSVVNYDIILRGSSLGEDYTQIYSGNGGLSRINLGMSYILFKQLSWGFQVNYLFGTISKRNSIDFDNSALFDGRNTIINSLNGFNFNTGLIFHGFDKLLHNKKLAGLNLAVCFSTPVRLNSDVSGRFETSTNTDSVEITNGKIDIPYSFGVGLSNTFDNKLTVAADFFMQKWDNYKYYGNHPDEIKNYLRIGAGLEYTPSKKPDAGFLKRMSYRIGGSYTQNYLKLNSKNINSITVSSGFTLPLSNFNRLDLLFSYTRRGTTDNNLIKEDIFRIGASVNIGELWFLKRNDDY